MLKNNPQAKTRTVTRTESNKLAWNLELCFHCTPNLERLILWKINCLCMVSLSAGPQPCGNDVLNVLGSSFTQMLTNFT